MGSFDFTDIDARAKFIAENTTDIYSAKNEYGETVIIELEQNFGMTVKTYFKSGKWVNIARYDNEGYCIDSNQKIVGFATEEDTSI